MQKTDDKSSEKAQDKDKKGTKLRFFPGLAYISIFLLACIWLTLQPIPAADTYWMLKTGEVISQLQVVPKIDIFSYTARGQPWINHEWLASVVFYLLYSWGGFSILYVFKTIVIISAYLIAAKSALERTRGDFTSVGLAGLIMVLISGGDLYFDVRAYLFTYLLLASSIYILQRGYYGKNPQILYLMVPLTFLWVNTHGGFILSYVLQALYLVVNLSIILSEKYRSGGFKNLLKGAGKSSSGEEKIKNEKQGINHRCRPLRQGGLTLLFSIAIGFINPYGLEIFYYPFSFLGRSFYREHLIEWIPPDYLGVNLLLTITVIIVSILAIIFHKNLRITDFCVTALFTYFAMTVVRHGVLYSIALIPIVSKIFSILGGKIKPQVFGEKDSLKKLSITASIIVFILTIILFFNFISTVNLERLNMERELFPVGGVKFLQLNPLPGRMYNPYEWGGYFIWKLYPDYMVFIDGRANTVYPESIYRESILSMSGDAGWEKIMDKYNVNFIFCNKYLRATDNLLLPDKLFKSKNWILIFEDDIELIFIRNIESNRRIIEKALKGKLRLPRTPYQLNQKAIKHLKSSRFKKADRLLMQALSINPRYLPAMLNLSLLKLNLGRIEEAEKILKKILKINPDFPRANFYLGVIYQKKKLPGKAIRYYQRELLIDPEFIPARERLNRLRDD